MDTAVDSSSVLKSVYISVPQSRVAGDVLSVEVEAFVFIATVPTATEVATARSLALRNDPFKKVPFAHTGNLT